MSANINKTFMAGRVASDIETRDVNGRQLTKFRFVTNRSYKKNDEWVTVPTFIACEAWGDLADRAGKLTKGAEVFITARLDLDEWEDKESGQKRSAHKLTLETIQALGGNQKDSEEDQDQTPVKKPVGRRPSKKVDDDLPF